MGPLINIGQIDLLINRPGVFPKVIETGGLLGIGWLEPRSPPGPLPEPWASSLWPGPPCLSPGPPAMRSHEKHWKSNEKAMRKQCEDMKSIEKVLKKQGWSNQIKKDRAGRRPKGTPRGSRGHEKSLFFLWFWSLRPQNPLFSLCFLNILHEKNRFGIPRGGPEQGPPRTVNNLSAGNPARREFLRWNWLRE